jgi:hypothetical protein
MSTTLSTVAILFGLAGFSAGMLALRTLARLRRSVALLSRGSSGRDTLLEITEQHKAASQAVRHDVSQLKLELTAAQAGAEAKLAGDRAEIAATMQQMAANISTVLRRVALVRYDAFEDLGGRLSFSLALLDDNGDGVTLTSIASQNETRLYAKSLANGIGEHALSPEEEQAVKAALTR